MDMEETQETQSPPAYEQGDDASGLSSGAKIGIGAGIFVAVVVLILALIFLLNNPATTETVRDLFIIALALESLVIGTLLVILIYQLIALIRMLRDNLKPIIESTRETVNTARGTATFVSQRVTKPAIAASSYVTGIGRSIGVLIQMLPRRPRSTPAQSSDEEAASEPG
jgi:hypothetical protein